MDARTPPPRSQTEDAYRKVRQALLSCAIVPGAKIHIGDLSRSMEVSPGAIREALSRLTAEDLVIAEPQRGFRAAPISRDDLLDLTRARAHIEALCLGEAVEHGDLGWEANVLAAHHRLSRLGMVGDARSGAMSDEWSAAHAEFHAALAEGCCSRWLLRMRATLYEQAERYRRLSLPMGEDKRDVAGEHRAICEAALGRDAPLARRLIRAHIERTSDIIMASLET